MRFNALLSTINDNKTLAFIIMGLTLSRWIMHIDMDAFFASVEQFRNHPHLIDKPVCVGPDPKKGHGRGVVSAVSYEARAFGIRSGMPISKAYKLCPEAVFVSADFQNYVKASDEFMQVLRGFADGGRVRRASIDEAYIEVTTHVKNYESPIKLAKKIQKVVKEKTALPCSIGIAPNMTVAKVATGMNKPMGITFVGQSREEIMNFLAPLPVIALNGVGIKTTDRLRRAGIETLGQIQKMTIVDLWPIMGRASKWLLNRARGIDERPLIDNGPRVRKSISKDITFMQDIRPEQINLLHHSIAKMCHRIAKKLQNNHLQAKTITVKIRYADYSTIQRSKTINCATHNRETIYQNAVDILETHRNPSLPIRLLGVRVSNFVELEIQPTIFEFI